MGEIYFRAQHPQPKKKREKKKWLQERSGVPPEKPPCVLRNPSPFQNQLPVLSSHRIIAAFSVRLRNTGHRKVLAQSQENVLGVFMHSFLPQSGTRTECGILAKYQKINSTCIWNYIRCKPPGHQIRGDFTLWIYLLFVQYCERSLGLWYVLGKALPLSLPHPTPPFKISAWNRISLSCPDWLQIPNPPVSDSRLAGITAVQDCAWQDGYRFDLFVLLYNKSVPLRKKKSLPPPTVWVCCGFWVFVGEVQDRVLLWSPRCPDPPTKVRDDRGHNEPWDLPESASFLNQCPTDLRKSDCFLSPSVPLPL